MSTIHKVAELQGAELDLAVALAEGHYDAALRGEDDDGNPVCMLGHPSAGQFFSPSTNWGLAGPLIEREHICIGANLNDTWWGRIPGEFVDWKANEQVGPTPLVAAMRAYIASKFDATVELP